MFTPQMYLISCYIHITCLNTLINLLIINLGKFSINFYRRGLGVDVLPGAPLTYLMMGGGGVRVIFLGLKFWPKVIFFGCMKDARIFLGCGKKREIFWCCKKRTKGFFGYAKKCSDFFG